MAALSSVFLATQTPCPVELPSGHGVRGGFAANPRLPRFTVHNRRSDHAFVKLENVDSGETHVFFVPRQSSVGIDSIRLGTYTVSYAMDGRLGPDCATLVQAKSVTQFSAPFQFYRREVINSDGSTGIEIGDNWIELGAEMQNSAEASQISLENFNQ